MSSEPAPSLFVPLDLHERFNAGRDVPPGRWSQGFGDALGAIPDGERRFWGVPFHLGPAGAPCWLLLGAQDGAVAEARVPWEGPGGPGYLDLSAPRRAERGGAAGGGPPSLSRAGEQVATYVLEYGDGSEHPQAVRWRFEINGAGPPWGQKAFAARSLMVDAPVEFRGPTLAMAGGAPRPASPRATARPGSTPCPIPTPSAACAPCAWRGRRRRGRGGDHRVLRPGAPPAPPAPAVVQGHAAGGGGQDRGRQGEVDLGVIARTYAVPAFDPEAWLAGEGISLPLPAAVPAEAVRAVVLDLSASADATLRVGERGVPLRPAFEGGRRGPRTGPCGWRCWPPGTPGCTSPFAKGRGAGPCPAGCTSAPRTGATCRRTGSARR